MGNGIGLLNREAAPPPPHHSPSPLPLPVWYNIHDVPRNSSTHSTDVQQQALETRGSNNDYFGSIVTGGGGGSSVSTPSLGSLLASLRGVLPPVEFFAAVEEPHQQLLAPSLTSPSVASSSGGRYKDSSSMDPAATPVAHVSFLGSHSCTDSNPNSHVDASDPTQSRQCCSHRKSIDLCEEKDGPLVAPTDHDQAVEEDASATYVGEEWTSFGGLFPGASSTSLPFESFKNDSKRRITLRTERGSTPHDSSCVVLNTVDKGSPHATASSTVAQQHRVITITTELRMTRPTHLRVEREGSFCPSIEAHRSSSLLELSDMSPIQHRPRPPRSAGFRGGSSARKFCAVERQSTTNSCGSPPGLLLDRSVSGSVLPELPPHACLGSSGHVDSEVSSSGQNQTAVTGTGPWCLTEAESLGGRLGRGSATSSRDASGSAHEVLFFNEGVPEEEEEEEQKGLHEVEDDSTRHTKTNNTS